MKTLKPYAWLAGGIAVLAALWWYFKPVPAQVGEWKPAEVAAPVEHVAKQEIRPKQVKVYTPEAKAKLKLPASMQSDANLYVLDSSSIKADDHPQTVTTVIDEQTGEVQTIVRRNPLPWLAVEQHGELRIDAGVKNGLARVGRLSLREDLLQVKALHAGINASIDSDGQYFAGVGVAWKW